MKAVIDRAGRIVVPKALRQALGLKPGQPLEIRAGDGRLEIEVVSTPMQLKKRRVKEPKALYGFRPFPRRGGIVTNEVIDRLREEDAY